MSTGEMFSESGVKWNRRVAFPTPYHRRGVWSGSCKNTEQSQTTAMIPGSIPDFELIHFLGQLDRLMAVSFVEGRISVSSFDELYLESNSSLYGI